MKFYPGLILGLAVASATLVHAAPATYDWTGGASGYTGWIMLDSDANNAGTVSDILAASITTPQGTYAFDPTMLYVNQANFTWTPSQITNMYFDWYSAAPLTGFGENISGSGTNFEGSQNGGNIFIDETGSWLRGANSSVPDSANTLILAALGLGGIVAARLRRSGVQA